MALRWLLHSAFHVLGYPNENLEVKYNQIVGYPYGEPSHREVTRLKGLSSANSIKELEYPSGFQMPLHYPHYTKADDEKMDEWIVDLLLKQYGPSFKGTLDEKRAFAMGPFLWSDGF